MYRIRAKVGGYLAAQQLTRHQAFSWLLAAPWRDDLISDYIVERFNTMPLEWDQLDSVKFVLEYSLTDCPVAATMVSPMTNPWKITEGTLVIGEHKVSKDRDAFSGTYHMNLEQDGVIFHRDVMRVVTDDAAQAQAICDILNAHKGEWQ